MLDSNAWQGPVGYSRISSPLIHENRAKALTDHPDQVLANFVLKGIEEGFRIGFDYAHQAAELKSAFKNMKSAQDNPTVVQLYIDAEVQAGRLLPVQVHHSLDRIHLSPFGVIPKRYQPGKWRLIVDLSSPKVGL